MRTDGCSVMLGSNAGVCVILLKQFPHLIIWHCMTHRLEFAVGNAVQSVAGVNHFKHFIDFLYCQSPKNQRQLESYTVQCEVVLKKFFRVLPVWCVASSWRTVSAVWNGFQAISLKLQ